jgi:hypothetical protein
MTLSETGLRLAFPNPQQFSLWNPLPGFKEIRDNPAQMAHLADLKDYFRDLRNGRCRQSHGSSLTIRTANIPLQRLRTACGM